ncbi:septation protein A [Affinibrenneria salicis]|uniref:Inner membrane-spanning protein YciB n=1 Tax=Affinibrenneria salicis TaxID=2590031 RepID=A0A5J5G459_9GAMM|nr:septation protein A [Affinibrenneria salicis]KAA9001828.1 septation protein A [Affinibrenneria salicis]
MKQFLDFLPPIVFFVVYKMYDIYIASGALIAATALTLLYSWIRYRKVGNVAIVTFVLVAVFGSLTIALHNDEFIKWKVTILYTLFAVALLFSQLVLKKNLIQKMLDKEIVLPEAIWQKLNVAWALFFLCCGLLNIYVAFWLSQDTWMNFKLFGLAGMTLLFTLASGACVYRYIPTQQEESNDKGKN